MEQVYMEKCGTPCARTRKDGGLSGEEGTSGPCNKQQANVNQKLQEVQIRVDEVMGLVHLNMVQLLERGHRLSELEIRSEALRQSAKLFEQIARKQKSKYWWKNYKIMVIIGIVCVVILIIIIALVVLT